MNEEYISILKNVNGCRYNCALNIRKLKKCAKFNKRRNIKIVHVSPIRNM